MRTIPYGLMGLGFVLLIASIFWSSFFPATNYWSEADEQQLEELQSKVHNLSYLVAEAENEPDPRKNRMSGEKMMEYRELKVQAEELLAQRDNASARPAFQSTLLRYGGIGSLLLGVGIYYVVRESD